MPCNAQCAAFKRLYVTSGISGGVLLVLICVSGYALCLQLSLQNALHCIDQRGPADPCRTTAVMTTVTTMLCRQLSLQQ